MAYEENLISACPFTVFGWDTYLHAFLNSGALSKEYIRQGYASVVGEHRLICRSPYALKEWTRSFLYVPMGLQVYSELALPSKEGTSHQLKQLVTFHVDQSNCGVGHFHRIHNHDIKGLGVYVLNAIERLFFYMRRKYITCTISEGQKSSRVGEWLEKHGYVVKDTFIGGNSANRCYLYVKDLNDGKSTFAKILPLVKEKKDV